VNAGKIPTRLANRLLSEFSAKNLVYGERRPNIFLHMANGLTGIDNETEKGETVIFSSEGLSKLAIA